MALNEEDDNENNEEIKVNTSILSPRLVLIASSVLIFLIIIAATLTYIKRKRDQEANFKPVIVEPKVVEVLDVDNILTGSSFRLDPFVINLNKGSGILRIRVAFIFYELELTPNFELNIPKLRDAVITEASAFSADTLVKKKGKNELKNKIKERLNNDKTLGLEVVDVLFEEFTIL